MSFWLGLVKFCPTSFRIVAVNIYYLGTGQKPCGQKAPHSEIIQGGTFVLDPYYLLI
jgi:hypothetical protein